MMMRKREGCCCFSRHVSAARRLQPGEDGKGHGQGELQEQRALDFRQLKGETVATKPHEISRRLRRTDPDPDAWSSRKIDHSQFFE